MPPGGLAGHLTKLCRTRATSLLTWALQYLCGKQMCLPPQCKKPDKFDPVRLIAPPEAASIFTITEAKKYTKQRYSDSAGGAFFNGGLSVPKAFPIVLDLKL